MSAETASEPDHDARLPSPVGLHLYPVGSMARFVYNHGVCSKASTGVDQQAGVGGIVLCGGRSRRMGTSKAWLRFGEEYLLQRVVRIVAGVVHPVVVAARPQQPLPPLPEDVLVTHDRIADAGPLAGIDAGFDALRGRCSAALVVSCDQPLLVPAFLRRLIVLLGSHPAVVPHDGTRSHPLTAVYRLSTHAPLKTLLSQGERRAGRFAHSISAILLSLSDLYNVDADLVSLLNVNEPQQLVAIRAHLSKPAR